MSKARFVDQKRVIKHIRIWQKRLGLRDWDIAIRFSDKKLVKKGRMAEIDTLVVKRVAWIVMRKTMPSPDMDLFGFTDIEMTVVHELVHCWFAATPGDRTHEEQAVHALSMALWRAYH